MKKTEYYGLSRSRDKKGVVVKRSLNPYASCIHATVGGDRKHVGANSGSL